MGSHRPRGLPGRNLLRYPLLGHRLHRRRLGQRLLADPDDGEAPERDRGEEHDDEAETGEEANLLNDPVQVVADRLAGAGAGVPERAERRAEHKPGAAQRGQPRAEDGGWPAPGAAQDQATENGPGGRQDLEPEAAGGVGERLVRRVCVMKIRADEGDEPAPDTEQDQQHSAEGATAPRNPQHPCHDDHSSREDGG